MHDTETPRTRSRSGIRRFWTIAGLLTLLVAVLPAGIASASQTIWVKPGQSIQAAVNRAHSGDTIQLTAGTWNEAVCIWKKGLKVVGAGTGKTFITWNAWTTPDQLPTVADNSPGAPCWKAYAALDAENALPSLNDDVSALFFYYPDSPVTVTGLTTKNHPANGITAWGANGFTVYATRGIAHERYGIVAAASKNIVIKGNVEQGLDRGAPVFSGTAGVSVGDVTGANAVVSGNRVSGENLGVFIREARGGTVSGNIVTGNCVGILVFDDSATEVPNTSGHVEGGAWKVIGNTATGNNRFCIAGRDGSQRVSGVGVAVVNTDHVTVCGNTIKNNQPTVPPGDFLTFPTGGVVLVSFQPPPDPNNTVDPGLVSYTSVTGNTILGNAPDIWVTRPIPGTLLRDPGPGNVIKNNNCQSSDPAGLCAAA